ncbi:hypothetical protein GCM10009755_24960 [Brevibacterium samyangense]|uniref:Uncharacterized protein n=2 Tax=Brevibacterium samyangense TaxID=366888 RepID=A0ABP5EZJ0_9MICO
MLSPDRPLGATLGCMDGHRQNPRGPVRVTAQVLAVLTVLLVAGACVPVLITVDGAGSAGSFGLAPFAVRRDPADPRSLALLGTGVAALGVAVWTGAWARADARASTAVRPPILLVVLCLLVGAALLGVAEVLRTRDAMVLWDGIDPTTGRATGGMVRETPTAWVGLVHAAALTAGASAVCLLLGFRRRLRRASRARRGGAVRTDPSRR